MQVHSFLLTQESTAIPADPEWDGPQTLVLAFFASGLILQPAPLEFLRTVFPQSYMLGCSTAGEIFGSNIEDNSVVVAILRFTTTQLCIAKTNVTDSGLSGETGANLGRVLAGPDLKGVFVLSDGLNVNGSELVRGFNDVLPAHVSVSGGLAGDGDRFEATCVIAAGPDEPLIIGGSQQVGAVGFRGDAIRLSFASKGGWIPFGLDRIVTRSVGNVLYELDGKPALELYKTYLGERAEGLPGTALLFPLAIRNVNSYGQKVLVRTILAIDEVAQSLTFAGDIPQDSTVQLMHCSMDRLVEGAGDAAKSLSNQIDGPALSIAISCVGRRLLLGQRAEEELEAVLEPLQEGTHQVGFYSYGELSPLESGQCQLHNQTMTITRIQES